MKHRSKRAWKQGGFTPAHPDKYKGSHPIVYRSGLELQVMRFFDSTSAVVEWGSETIIIPYIKPTDGKLHRYYTDFNVALRNKNGDVVKYLIEVKPYKQTLPPTNHGNKKPRTLLYEQVNYAINTAKWEAAREWAGKHGYIFTTFTEKDIAQFMR